MTPEVSAASDTPGNADSRYDRLPCGCLAGIDLINGVATFVFIPHARDCEYFIYVREETARQGKELTVVDAS